MTYPDSGSAGQGYPQPAQHQRAGSASTVSIETMLVAGVAVLGLVVYFVSLSLQVGAVDVQIWFLLVGGLLGGLTLLPRGPRVLPFATVFSVLGALTLISVVVRASDPPGVLTVMLILGILQMLLAILALLVAHGLVAIPAKSASARQQHQAAYPQQGPYPQPQAPQPTLYHQPPPPSQPPTQQPTQYTSRHGEFFGQQAGEDESSRHQQRPPTPPRGFDQQG